MAPIPCATYHAMTEKKKKPNFSALWDAAISAASSETPYVKRRKRPPYTYHYTDRHRR
jgi:ribosomal protein L20